MPPPVVIPLVGAPCEITDAVLAVAVRCTCQPSNKVFIIPGIDTAKICVECGNVYAITQYAFTRTSGVMARPQATVSIVGNKKAMVDAARVRATVMG